MTSTRDGSLASAGPDVASRSTRARPKRSARRPRRAGTPPAGCCGPRAPGRARCGVAEVEHREGEGDRAIGQPEQVHHAGGDVPARKPGSAAARARRRSSVLTDERAAMVRFTSPCPRCGAARARRGAGSQASSSRSRARSQTSRVDPQLRVGEEVSAPPREPVPAHHLVGQPHRTTGRPLRGRPTPVVGGRHAAPVVPVALGHARPGSSPRRRPRCSPASSRGAGGTTRWRG